MDREEKGKEKGKLDLILGNQSKGLDRPGLTLGCAVGVL